jgi:adenosine deaminase
MIKTNHFKMMPKIELHCHLDGSLQIPTIKRLAEIAGIPFPESEEEQFRLFHAPAETKDLNEYLEKFEFVGRVLQTKEALEIAAYDVLQQASNENVKYIEVRFAPTLHTMQGLSLPDIIESVVRGLKKGEVDFGLKANALLCGLRHEPIENAKKIAELTHDYLNKGVSGFDLAGNEIDFPPHTFADAIKVATDYEIPLTLHAGECHCGKNVYDAVILGAQRIGHGVALKDTPEYIQTIIDKKIVFEMAPTSNFQTKTVANWEEYPIKQFLDKGIKVTVNTDNRTVSNTTLTDEYIKLYHVYGFSYDDYETFNQNAIFGAFLPQNEKDKLEELVRLEFENLKSDD